jgi:hypothetical protein
MGERPPEMQLFHGTSAANIDSSVLFSNSRILVPSKKFQDIARWV